MRSFFSTLLCGLVLSPVLARADLAMIDNPQVEFTRATDVEAVNEDSTDWTKPYAVLGRGVMDRQTGKTLQLACKTEPVKNAAGELQCAEVQFIEIDDSGTVTEIGRTLKVGVDFNSTSGFKRILKARVKALKKSGEIPGRELFSSTKHWLTMDASLGTKALPFLLGGGVALTLATGGAPLIATIGVGLFAAFPVGIDVILVPLGLSVNAIKGNYFIGNKTLSVYGWVRDRDPKYWQFKPRKMSNKNYERFKTIVSSSPKRVLRVARIIVEAGDGQRTEYVEVEYKDGHSETIRYPSNLVIYSKQERREYGPNGRVN